MLLRPIPNIRVGIPPIVSASLVTNSSKVATCSRIKLIDGDKSSKTLSILVPLSTIDFKKSWLNELCAISTRVSLN